MPTRRYFSLIYHLFLITCQLRLHFIFTHCLLAESSDYCVHMPMLVASIGAISRARSAYSASFLIARRRAAMQNDALRALSCLLLISSPDIDFSWDYRSFVCHYQRFTPPFTAEPPPFPPRKHYMYALRWVYLLAFFFPLPTWRFTTPMPAASAYAICGQRWLRMCASQLFIVPRVTTALLILSLLLLCTDWDTFAGFPPLYASFFSCFSYTDFCYFPPCRVIYAANESFRMPICHYH